MSALFCTGKVVATPGALEVLESDGGTQLRAIGLLERHMSGDYGTIDSFDKQQNADALKHGGRILSAYEVNGTKVWVITEADRSYTTILLPEEY